MDAPINRNPRGFLSFLDLKTMGVTPRTLGGSVAPVLDLTPFYFNDAELTVQFTRTLSAAATNAFVTFSGVSTWFGLLTVPQDEWWYVRDWGLTWIFDALAGQTASLNLQQLTAGGLLSNATQTFNNLITASAAAESLAGVSTGRDWWLAPGSSIGVTSARPIVVGGGSIAAILNTRLIRLRA